MMHAHGSYATASSLSTPRSRSRPSCWPRCVLMRPFIIHALQQHCSMHSCYCHASDTVHQHGWMAPLHPLGTLPCLAACSRGRMGRMGRTACIHDTIHPATNDGRPSAVHPVVKYMPPELCCHASRDPCSRTMQTVMQIVSRWHRCSSCKTCSMHSSSTVRPATTA